MRLKRPSGPWTAVAVVLAGLLAPLITYHFDWILRYRVGYWVHRPYLLGGVLEVIGAQARDQPWSLVALVGAPVAAAGFIVIAWIRRSARERTTNRKRIGGWLAVFVFAIISGMLVDIHGLYLARHAIWVNLRALPHLRRTMAPTLVLLILARHAVVAVSIVALLVGLWLIIRRSARAPAYWTIVCASLAPAHVYEGAIGVWERRVGAGVHIVLFPNANFGRAVIISAIAALAWCVYWLRSRRVLETFGRRGIDLFVERSASPELAAVPTSETPP